MQPDFNPFYAVIFTSKKSENDSGYDETASLMETLAKEQPGFLSMDSVRNEIGLTVSYWKDLEAIKNWKNQAKHLIAQQKGKDNWYVWYDVKICKVERAYSYNKL
ncbi:MAG: antibiotic biosynthesis monooxygenase [Flavobacteriaceae bacterium CG_4_8_14_3_um_filter_34_10]|nr:MAG: antibiotic biosynthesis monooxygenase [Flavobacteriaceae bacterium CG2_30_34_30]PIQ18116.1 MAG: antibiotic biosynthesis monooxygenase [Flavobacteriaceae bacterium CG18_big_fil_WC_8_21_14_2_50_34_36]PIX10257.1 MAG: antibiotic biosynthesis monooxygenase [Flavobacteriaceae bacterium CG_4_8_14_3_um_filter_34_10]PJC07111.1 MAG: antibiotic biosynthesis monooxygenase [Flavobacteriaceae bacterium CG_4_9_14_0_8_um_filter_34_30]